MTTGKCSEAYSAGYHAASEYLANGSDSKPANPETDPATRTAWQAGFDMTIRSVGSIDNYFVECCGSGY